MQYTSNLNLKKPDSTDYVNVSDLNDNMDIIDQTITEISDSSSGIEQQLAEHLDDDVKHLNYATASGTNTYTASIPDIESLVEGLSIKIKFTNSNTGASTLNINGLGAKSILKGNGNSLYSGNIKAGQICHLVYTGSVFQLLGEGGEYGTATAPDVLNGKTIGTEEGLINGTMPNIGAINQSLSINGTYTIPEGYHNGSGKVSQSITTKGAQTYTPKTTNQTISSGQYLTGTQTILGDSNLIASNIKQGINIFGVVGTVDITSLGGKRWASGTTISANNRLAFNGLGFRPKLIFFWDKDSTVSDVFIGIYSEYDHSLQYLGGVYVSNLSTKYRFLKTDAIITNSSFDLSVPHNNQNWNWVAYE